jgi:polyhydroxyalkanoate synthase
VANLLDQGVDVYVVDWGRPDRGDRYVTLGDYVEWWVDGCVDAICERHHLEKINVLGICQGGTMSLCYAALHPERVQNLITIVTPVDFSPHSIVNEWTREIDADAMADSLGSIPGDLITAGFMTRSPFEKNLRKYVDLVDLLDDERKLLAFLRMEKWIFDTPDLPGDSFRQWLKDFYQGNKLIAGEVELAGRRVDLRNITMPVLNVYGEQDDVVPPEMAEPLGRHVGTSDYTARSYPVGHIGMYVSSRMQTELAPTLASWLFERG